MDGVAGELENSNDLYDQAVAVVIRDRKASTSYIQRRLSIGYNRAASLIESYRVHASVLPKSRPSTGFERFGAFEARVGFVACECLICSLGLAHSRLSRRLLDGSPSMWLTVVWSSRLGSSKATAMSRWRE